MEHIKCALIAVARDEDKYIDEWVKYHLNMGIDHIYICDNNDSDKSLVYENDKVTIYPHHHIDFSKGIYKSQCTCYNNVLNDIWDKYDYCAIIDIDEFLHFKKCSTVQNFIKRYLINGNYNVVEIAWEVYDDNDLIFHIDKPVRELYKRVQSKMSFKWMSNECSWGKSIFKLCEGIKANPHWPEPDSMKEIGGFRTIHIDKNDAVIDHYRTKCLEDYMKHKFSQCNIENAPFTHGGNIIRTYFDFNIINLDKLMWALKFAKDCNYKLSDNDRQWVINTFSKGFSPITVVIRTHNRLEKLKHCLNCIYNQYNLCKLLILNDGSSDDTTKWLSTQDVDYLSLKDNVGPGEILARGKYLITTPYYIILDDDDTWSRFDVIDFFYNTIIDNPYADFIDTGYSSLHTGYLISTKLLLDCPNISAWSRDDWYFDWIKSNAKNLINKSFKFYNWDKHDDDYRYSTLLDKTTAIIGDYYNRRNEENILNTIDNIYYSSNIKERKVFDQIKSYYETGKIYNI